MDRYQPNCIYFCCIYHNETCNLNSYKIRCCIWWSVSVSKMKTITRLLFSLKVVFQRECVNVVLSLPGQLGRWGEKRETCLSGVSSRHPSCPSWRGRPSTVRSLLTSQPRTLTGALRWIRITSDREKYLGFLPSQDNFLVFLFSQLTSEILI